MSAPMVRKPVVRYHRNGMSGVGFYAVAFTHGRGKAARLLMAIVHDRPGCCSVVTPGDPLERWRGDNFESELRAAIAAADASGESFRHD